jgi:hypothetical protein
MADGRRGQWPRCPVGAHPGVGRLASCREEGCREEACHGGFGSGPGGHPGRSGPGGHPGHSGAGDRDRGNRCRDRGSRWRDSAGCCGGGRRIGRSVRCCCCGRQGRRAGGGSVGVPWRGGRRVGRSDRSCCRCGRLGRRAGGGWVGVPWRGGRRVGRSDRFCSEARMSDPWWCRTEPRRCAACQSELRASAGRWSEMQESAGRPIGCGIPVPLRRSGAVRNGHRGDQSTPASNCLTRHGGRKLDRFDRLVKPADSIRSCLSPIGSCLSPDANRRSAWPPHGRAEVDRAGA